jgi:hypothetical protein
LAGQATPVGREPELASLHEFVAGRGHARGLVISGGPGIGKSTPWEAGIEAARTRGLRVLVSRASVAETRLSFGTLVDLLDGIDLNSLAGLPPPQLRALEVALLRTEPVGGPPEPGMIALGFLGALLEVGPLSFGAVRRLLSERPGLSLPRQLLRRIVDSTLGNPLRARARQDAGRRRSARGRASGFRFRTRSMSCWVRVSCASPQTFEDCCSPSV